MALTVAQLVARVTADTSGFYRGMAIANSSMLRTGGIIGRVAAGAGLATLGMGIMSLRAAGNFEESMNILEAVAEPTKKQFEDLRDEAIKLGADLKLPNVSAKDAAHAMQELAKGGLTVDQILGSVRGTLQLGLAANTDFATSAVIVARALKAFNLQGSEATTVADLFAAAANKSTAEMTDIALGFQMASAQFAAGDQTIQALTTSLAIMADAGIVGSDAGTSLKTMMNRLMAPTKKAASEMENLGFKVYDSAGNMKDMPTLIGDLQTSLAGMTKEQRNATLYTIFGSDAIRAARVMLNEGEAGWRKYEKSITKGGEAQRITEARTKGLNGAMQAFGSAVETQAILLGTALLPAATAVVRAMTSLVMAIDPDKIIGFFTAIKDGVVWVWDFVAANDAAQFAVAGLVSALAGLFIGYQLIQMFRAIQAAWILLNAAFIATPLGLIILAIGALIGALVLAYMKSEEFRAVVDKVFSWMRDTIPPIISNIANMIRTHWETIKNIFQTSLNVILTWWNLTWGRALEFVKNNWDQISGLIKAHLDHIMISIRGALKTIEGIINLVMGVIKGDWGRAWEGIKQILDGTLGTLAALIKHTLVALVPATLSLALAIGKAILEGIGKGILQLSSFLYDKMYNGISGAIAAVMGWVGGAAAAIGQAITSGILSGIGGLAGALKDKLTGAVSGALSSVKSLAGIGSPSRLFADELGKPLAEGVIAGWLEGANELPAKMAESLKKAFEAGKVEIDKFKAELKEAFDELTEAVFSAFDAQTEAFRTAAEKSLAAFDIRKKKEELQQQMKELREALLAEQLKFAQMRPPELVRGEGETETDFAARAQRETDAYLQSLGEQSIRIAEAQKAIDDELARRADERKRANLQKEADESRKAYEIKRTRQKQRLEEELTDLQDALNKHPEMHKTINKQIQKLLHSFGVDYRNAGHTLGHMYAQGIMDSVGAIRSAANSLAQAIERLLRLRSPAKEGPLSDLHKWWAPFADTLVSGLSTRPITAAAAAMAGLPHSAVGGASFAQSARSMTTGGAGGTTIIYVQGSLIHERELDARIREGVLREANIGRRT